MCREQASWWGVCGWGMQSVGRYPWASWAHSQMRCPQWLMGRPFNGISDIVSRICVYLIVFSSESWLLFSQMPTKPQSYSLSFNILSGMRDKYIFLTVTHTAEKLGDMLSLFPIEGFTGWEGHPCHWAMPPFGGRVTQVKWNCFSYPFQCAGPFY